jgi:dephospho-CoA kinase
MKLPSVIGICGTFASGKDTLAEYLVKEFGYTHVSTGDMVRVESKRRYGSIEREYLQKTGPELKRERGAGVLVDLALEQSRPLVVSGIRSLGEAKAIQAKGGVMVFIDAEPKKRYERMQKRARDEEAQKSFEEFCQLDTNEWHAGEDESDFNIRDIKKIANIHIYNNGSIKEYLEKSLQALEQH